MRAQITKLALATAAASTLFTLTGGPAWAGGVTPANTLITGTMSNWSISGQANGVAFSVGCAHVTLQFTTPSSGYGPVPVVEDPSFSSCSDSVSGADTVAVNHTNGPWTITFDSVPHLLLTISQASITITTSALPGCVITLAPTGPVMIIGPYANLPHHATFSGAPVPVSGTAACGSVSSPWGWNGTLVLNPAVTVS